VFLINKQLTSCSNGQITVGCASRIIANGHLPLSKALYFYSALSHIAIDKDRIRSNG